MTKNELRSLVGPERKMLDETAVLDCSIRIQKRILGMESFARSSVVACYMAFDGEVRTDMIVSACREAGKKVCMPAYRRDIGDYRLVVMEEGVPIVAGRAGVPEPACGEVFSLRSVGLVLVPGVAFDISGRRVGRGRGHYDSLLSSEKHKAVKLGLAYEFQVFDNVPAGGNDINMDLVVTEDRIIDCTL